MKKTLLFFVLCFGMNTLLPAQTVTQTWATLASDANPVGIAIDRAGNVYTANNIASTISKITSAGVVTRSWAILSWGTNPVGIAIDTSNNVYTISSNLNTVSKITSAGVITQYWADLASGAGPSDIAIDASGNIYTANNNGTVSKITPAGVITQSWAALASNANPRAIAIDALGNVYTANYGNNTVSKITPAGVVTQSWAALASGARPTDIAIDALGNAYTANNRINTVSKITSAGIVFQSWAVLAEVSYPRSIAINASGNVIYTANDNGTVSKIPQVGVVTQSWADLGWLSSPESIAMDASGNVYTANKYFNTVSKIDPRCWVSTSQNRTIRQGDSVVVNNRAYRTSGTYQDTIIRSGLCDSIVTTNLTVVACNLAASISRMNNNITATPTGGRAPYTYRWNTQATTATLTNIAFGAYTVTVTDSIGCTATATFNRCQVGSSQNRTIRQGDSVVVNNRIYRTSGTFRDTIVRNGLCDSIVITNLTVVTCNMTARISRIDNNNATNITAAPTGGRAPYTYRWNTQATTATLTNIPFGTYIVTVTDSIGCTATATFYRCQVANTQNRTIRQGDSVVLNNRAYRTNGTFIDTIIRVGFCDSIVTTNLTVVACNLAASISRTNNNLTATPTGGRAPYTYRWNNQATTATLTNIAFGAYTVTITDSIGCTATATFNRCQVGSSQNRTIRQGDSVVVNNRTYRTSGTFRDTIIRVGLCDSIVTTNLTVVACNLAASISLTNNNLTATPTGGRAPYTYRWNTQATTSTLTNIAFGSYTVTVTDSIGCTATANILFNSSKDLFSQSFKVFPNPTADNVYLQFSNPMIQSDVLTIYNVLGQTQKVIVLPQGIEQIEVNISDFTKGVYLFQINDKMVRVIKQ